MMPAISALVSAPNKVMTPASNQIPSSRLGEPNCAAITAGFLKMPDPITPPMTSVIVVKRPRLGTKPAGWRVEAVPAGLDEVGMSGDPKLQIPNPNPALRDPSPKSQARGWPLAGFESAFRVLN